MLCRGPGGALVVQRREVLGERGVLDGEAERLAVRVDVVDDLPVATANTSSRKGLGCRSSKQRAGLYQLSDTHRVHVVVHRARVLKLEVAAPREEEVVRAHPAGALLDEGGHRMREGDDVGSVGRRLLRQVQPSSTKTASK